MDIQKEPAQTANHDIATLIAQPERLLQYPREQLLAMPAAQVAPFQLEALARRFDSLVKKIPVLRNLAHEQAIDSIQTLADGARLLFKHSVYKSYPVSLIEKHRYDKLTAWLGNLTTLDMSGVQTVGLQSIDDWIDALDAAGIRIIHTTGTSGKLSFLPRGVPELRLGLRAFLLGLGVEGEPQLLSDTFLIVPAQRVMFNGYGIGIDAVSKQIFHGDESRIIALDPGRLSADVLSVAGRLAAAEAKGELGRIGISPSLLAKRESFVRNQQSAPERRRVFLSKLINELRGKRIVLAANWPMLYDMAVQGEGIKNAFAPDSLIFVAGGTKGRTLPQGYQQVVREFLGVSVVQEGYGMSEMTTTMPRCDAGNYHALPWMIPYLLDGDTGALLPRQGTHTGRFGIIDLAAQTYWGGFLSGDEVTMSFGTCACGSDSPFIGDKIRRFSEKEGGDDKITCAGAPEAHDKAIAFLADFQQDEL